MCGIAGTVDWGDPAALARMTDLMSHRGPDDRGLWTTTTSGGHRIGLGARRLAILDLSPAGHMPMSTPDGALTIVYNGECYNSPLLRAELEASGVRFRSRSDTEVVLEMYRAFGADCLPRLNGMFAFALWDRRQDHLVLARDHFGIKPLYYLQDGPRLAFASEVKALLSLPGVRRSMDLEALRQYLTFLWVPEPLTMFEGVRKLPAAHFAVWKDGDLEVSRYWDLSFPPAGKVEPYVEADLVFEGRRRFLETVRAQMLSDVPVGAFLSAGLDSSSVVAAMARATGTPVRTYTIGFPEHQRKGETTLDDIAVARRTAQALGCEHTEIIVEASESRRLPGLIYHMDEPTADPHVILAYLVSREARKNVTVLLSGVGGDEVFAGYRKYRAHYLAEYYRLLPRAVRERLLAPLIESLPSMQGTRFNGYVRWAKKMVRSGSLPPRERFIRDSVYLPAGEIAALCTEALSRSMPSTDPRARHLDAFDRVSAADFLHQMMYVDLRLFLTSLNLNITDKMAMANSVEARVPLLDRELCEWVAQAVPPGLKIHGTTTKYLLRQIGRPLFPREVLFQKKAGFGAPLGYWVGGELKEMVEDLLAPEVLRRRGLFRPQAVRSMVQEQHSGRRDWSVQIWQLLSLELWMQVFLDQPPPASASDGAAPVSLSRDA
jgi:asparagine synthase (glutamine-hydrolysing)